VRGKRRPRRIAPETLAPVGSWWLGIDPGATSGYAIGQSGPRDRMTIVASAQGKDTAEHRRRAVIDALGRAGGPRKLWIALEGVPYFGTLRTAVGVGQRRGRWLHVLEEVGIPPSHVAGPEPQAWRAELFGAGVRLESDAWKARAREYVARRWRLKAPSDEAEACCLLAWARAVGTKGDATS
jgi:hypothetical protein